MPVTLTALARQCIRAIDANHSCVIREGLQAVTAKTNPTGPCGGKTLIEMIWDELMEVYGRLVLREAPEDYQSDRGRAAGLATALAILANPYNVDVDAIRAQATARWEALQGSEQEGDD